MHIVYVCKNIAKMRRKPVFHYITLQTIMRMFVFILDNMCLILVNNNYSHYSLFPSDKTFIEYHVVL